MMKIYSSAALLQNCLLGAGFRSDYSSEFGDAKTPFNFPRGTIYFRPSELLNKNFLTDWKLRAAYGEAGIQPERYARQVTLGVQPLGTGAGRVARGDRTMDGRHGSRGSGRRTTAAERVADRGDGVANLHRRGITERDGGQTGRAVQLEERHVVGRVDPDDGCGGGAVTGDRDLDARGALDHMVVRQDLAVGREHHAGARAKGTEPVGAQHLLGRVDVDDRADRGRPRGTEGVAGRGQRDGGAGGRHRRSGRPPAAADREETSHERE